MPMQLAAAALQTAQTGVSVPDISGAVYLSYSTVVPRNTSTSTLSAEGGSGRHPHFFSLPALELML